MCAVCVRTLLSHFRKLLNTSCAHCLQGVRLSEREKRTPISIYLTPRASATLREYSMGSGYGSLSRTVEEIILAFDFTYNAVKDIAKHIATTTAEPRKPFTDAEKLSLFVGLLTTLSSIENAISRLYKESQSIP